MPKGKTATGTKAKIEDIGPTEMVPMDDYARSTVANPGELAVSNVQDHPRVIIVESGKRVKVVFTDTEDRDLLEFLNKHFDPGQVFKSATLPIFTVLGNNSR